MLKLNYQNKKKDGETFPNAHTTLRIVSSYDARSPKAVSMLHWLFLQRRTPGRRLGVIFDALTQHWQTVLADVLTFLRHRCRVIFVVAFTDTQWFSSDARLRRQNLGFL
ncbi:hypothetical protein Csa_016747 [Cucumis sativus]|uniref:Uncharacterized protein n=1 Tax=Cucumis sativus TaxID=3659 RepID=A0A0A0K4H4_CUCSA|nr:hypothetical protein Csa_016747 [Cucumis sativus]